MPTFNVQKALESGKSEDDILGYLASKNPKFNVGKAIESGKTKQELMSYLSTVEAPQGSTQELPGPYDEMSKEALSQFNRSDTAQGQPEQGDFTKPMSTAAGTLGILPPKTGYELGKSALKNIVRPAVEGTATIGGAVIGSPIVGSAISYAASNQFMDLVEDYYDQKAGGKEPEQRTVGGELSKVGKDVALVIATGAAFKYAPKVIEAIPKTPGYVFETLPKRLVSSALKMPNKKSWIQTLSSTDVSKQMRTVGEVIKSDIPISEKGLAQAKQLRNEIHSFIDDSTKILSENPDNRIKFNKVIAKGLRRAYAKAANSADKVKAKKLVDDVKKGLKAQGESLTPNKANSIKRDLWDKANWFVEGLDPIVSTSYKGVARGIADSIEKMYPPIGPANRVFADRMSVVESLEKTLVLMGKNNIVPLPSKVLLAGTHPKLGVVEYIFGRPRVKAQIAQWLSKARPEKFSKFIYPEKPLGYTPPIKKIERAVYSDLIKIRTGKNQQLINAGYYETGGLSKGLDLPIKKALPLGSTTISGVKNAVVKSIIPQIKTTIRPAELKQIIKTKVAERIEKEEAVRAMHLEKMFSKQKSGKTIGPPLIKRGLEMTKSKAPVSVSQRLKDLKIGEE